MRPNNNNFLFKKQLAKPKENQMYKREAFSPGKPVASHDPRKSSVVMMMRRRHPEARKLTAMREIRPGVFQARLFGRDFTPGSTGFKILGIFELDCANCPNYVDSGPYKDTV